MSNGTDSLALTLSSSVNRSKTMVISNHEVDGNVNADDLPCTELIDNNTVTYTRTGTARNLKFVTYVVEFTDDTDVVHGSIRMLSSDTDVSTSICSVDPDSAVLINPSNFNRAGTNCYTTTDDMGYAWGTLEFTDGTTVRARRPTSGAAVVFPFQAVEFSTATPTGCVATEPGTSTPRTNSGGLCSSTLPIELLDFYVSETTMSSVTLSWITSTEVNNDFFEIQRSINLSEWEFVGIIDGNGTKSSETNYSFVDENPYSVGYCRLKQTDFDGTETAYHAVSANLITTYNDQLALYPNPANQGIVTINTGFSSENTQILIRDLKGNEILRFKNIGDVFELNTDNLSRGVYLIESSLGSAKKQERLVFTRLFTIGSFNILCGSRLRNTEYFRIVYKCHLSKLNI